MFILPEVEKPKYLPCKSVDGLSEDKGKMILIYAFMVDGEIQYFYTSGNFKDGVEVLKVTHRSPKSKEQGSIP